MTHYHAPDRRDNFAGPRDFAYLAEVDILGWKFRAMQDGSFVIDTPGASEDAEGDSMMFSISDGHKRLLKALLDLEPSGAAPTPDHWENVGRFTGR